MKAIIYARFSPRPDADESTSNEAQIRRCREYCEQRGYEVEEPPEHDDDISGGLDAILPEDALAKQVGLLRAVERLQRGMVLVVRWRSRLARSVFLEEWVIRQLRRRGVRIEAADEAACPWDDPDANLLRQILAALRERERAVTRRNTKLAMLRHQANNRRMSRIPPYGKRIDPADPKRLTEDPAEQDMIRIILDEAGRRSVRGLVRWLNEQGLQCRGREWNRSTVRAILRRAADA